jgi:amino acid adenylation domain-containing protein
MKTMMKTLESHPISQNLLHHKIYWLHRLSGDLPETGILTDYLRSERYSHRNKTVSFELGDRLSQAVIQLSQNSYLSIYILLLSAFSSLLNKYTSQNDLMVGMPRYRSINHQTSTNQVVPLRLHLADDLSFKELLLHVKDAAIQAYTHQNYPLDNLLSTLEIQQQSNRCALYDIVVLLENIHSSPTELNHDLTVSWCINQGKITGKIEYSDSLYKEETIKTFVEHYINVIEHVIENLSINVADIVLLSEDEAYDLLERFNSNTKNYPVDQTIHSLFETQVQQSPSHIAAVYQGKQLTYQELNTSANQIARFLRDLGIRNNNFVGILQGRNLNFLQSILAVLKAGGAYVPIDNTYPPERVQYMLSNSEINLLLTDSTCLQLLSDHPEQYSHLKSVICLDVDSDYQINTLSAEISLYSRSNFSRYSADNLAIGNCSSDRAYMLYTSGSTGSPKGAIIRHDGAINHIYAQVDALKLNQGLRFLQSAPASSDISVWQFLAPLLIGGCTFIVDTETVCDAEKLFQVIQTERLTLVELVPVVLKGLIDYGSQLPVSQRSLSQLQWMMVTGESVSVSLINQWLGLYPSIPIVNAYGPTEAADDITQLIVEQMLPEDQRSVSIGKPLANVTLYVLDAQMRLVPIGVPGEICVSGIGVGDGYWKNEAKTNLSFVPNPFANPALSANHGDTIYKTGDLGRWLPDGTIEYLGRMDHQVKIRGFRIELGEIEAALRQHPAIQDTVVVVREDQPGDKRLVAYGVANADTNIIASDLRDFLHTTLPDYMVPSAFVLLSRLPLTPSGKIDRNALPAPDMKPLVKAESNAVTSPVEEILIGIWSKVLGCDQVGVHDNFFELGGHSLLATLIISQVRQVFQRELPLRRLFELPTIAQFATTIETATQANLGIDIPPIERRSTETTPLSFAQQRLWFLAQLEPDSPFYNIATAISLQGSLNVVALEQTFTEILRRHEVLRTRVTVVNEQPIATVAPAIALPLPVIDLSALPEPQRDAEVRSLISAEGQQPFDLSCDLLLRIKLLRLAEDDHILLVTMHHSAADGWSSDILIDEGAALYQAFCQHQPSPLPALSIQYADFAVWQHQWLQGEILDAQMDYWRKRLADAPTPLELPTDRPHPAIQSYRGNSYRFQLAPELPRSLHHLSQQAGCTLFMTLLAAFNVLLGRYSGSEDIVVGTPIANRHRAEVEGLIGCFVNTLVLRTDLSCNPTVLELLEQVRERALEAYTHQDLPFEQLVEALQPQRSLSHTPLFQVMFVFQNTPASSSELEGLRLSPLPVENKTAKFNLTLFLEQSPQGLTTVWEYNTDLFDASTIERMAGHFQTLLEGMVAQPQQRISELPLLTTAEQHQLLVEWNDTQADYFSNHCIHELFEMQSLKSPDAVAAMVVDVQSAASQSVIQQLTYRELNDRANKVAHYLRTLGVGPDVRVGICIERSLEMVVGLLGILKAGGAYVPLDPTYPQERLRDMLQDAAVSVLLTQQSLVELLPSHQANVVCLDSQWKVISTQSQENPASGVSATNLAYVIYTSGSTGKPKGIAMQHHSLVNLIVWQIENAIIDSKAKTLQFAPVSFDVSFQEIFSTWCGGGTLVLISEEIRRDAHALLRLCVEEKIERLFLPVIALQQLAQVANDLPYHLASLQEIITAGEQLQIPPSLIRFFNDLPGCVLHNHYGPSETHVVTAFTLQGSASDWPTIPSIGRPIANTQIYILDNNLQPVPIGVPGELYVGGVGVAWGYFNRSDLTQEKFIPDPFSSQPQARLYKTGDLARYLPDGNIQFLGRRDRQVKTRGFRIEPGEIETVLSTHPQVQQAVIVVRGDDPANKHLVAYLVSHEESPSGSQLRNFLKQKLPDYMIPSAFVMLEALPLTPSGKLDHQALRAADEELSRQDNGVLPRTLTEAAIANIVAAVLGLQLLSIHDNFFEIGGHSLLATRVISRLREEFEMELPLRSLFEKPTVAELAEWIDTLRLSIVQVADPITAIEDGRTEIEL